MPSQSLAFDRAAEFYDETRGFPPGMEQPVAALLCRVGNLAPTSRVLEIGIGTGRIALPLGEHVGAIYGIDLARAMLERLRTKQSGQPVYVVQGDAITLPFPTGVFDAVVAVHVFHLIAGWQRALDEVARVLRPGGLLISGYNDRGEEHPTDQLLWAAWREAVGEAEPPNVGVARDAYATFLDEAGWRPVGETQRHALGTEIHSPARFLQRLQQRTWSSLWRVSDEALAQGVAAVRAALLVHQLDPNESYNVERSFNAHAYQPPL